MPEFVEGDTGTVLEVKCKDQYGRPINLTTYTAELIFVIGSTRTVRTMEQTEPEAGKARYQFVGNELIQGIMLSQIKLTSGAGTVLTSAQLEPITVLPRL